MLKKNRNKFTSGYTIIETMIALAIFLIVIVVGVGALLNAYNVNKKSQNMRSIMDSLSFTMEDMSRNIRTGYNYKCLERGQTYDSSTLSIPGSCRDGYGIAFEHSEGDPEVLTDQWVYYIDEGKLFKSTNGGPENSIQMTPNEVVLDANSVIFSVIGAESDDNIQPLVIIRLVGKITSGGNATPFSLQTAISQRLSDISND